MDAVNKVVTYCVFSGEEKITGTGVKLKKTQITNARQQTRRRDADTNYQRNKWKCFLSTLLKFTLGNFLISQYVLGNVKIIVYNIFFVFNLSAYNRNCKNNLK